MPMPRRSPVMSDLERKGTSRRDRRPSIGMVGPLRAMDIGDVRVNVIPLRGSVQMTRPTCVSSLELRV